MDERADYAAGRGESAANVSWDSSPDDGDDDDDDDDDDGDGGGKKKRLFQVDEGRQMLPVDEQDEMKYSLDDLWSPFEDPVKKPADVRIRSSVFFCNGLSKLQAANELAKTLMG